MPSSLLKESERGRTEFGGPVTGIYKSWTIDISNIPASSADHIAWGVVLPYDFRVYRVFARARVEDVTSATMQLRQDPSSFSTTGAAILTAALAPESSAGNVAGAESGDDTTIVQATRDVPSGSYFYLDFDTVSGTNGIDDCSVEIFGFVSGHINTDESDD